MSSYSVKDKSYYELDQYNRAKKRLNDRSKQQIQKISDEVENTKLLSKSLLQSDSIISIDSSIKQLIYLALKANDVLLFKTVGQQQPKWTIIEANSNNIFSDYTLIKFNITELNNKYYEIFKTIDASKIPDLKIIIENINTYLRSWSLFYDKLGMYFRVTGPQVGVIPAPIRRVEVDKNNYELLKEDKPTRKAATDIFTLPPNTKITLNLLFYPAAEINFKYNKLLKQMQKNFKLYINTHQEIKSGSGLAQPYHNLHKYVSSSNNSNQLPQRFL